MFKTDLKSLEKLSFVFNDQDINRFQNLLREISSEDLSTLPQTELVRIYQGLDYIIQLKTEGKIYAFHVEDSWSDTYGVELYLRQGNRLEGILYLDQRVPEPEKAIKYLQEMNIQKIYTGNIPLGKDFLGCSQELFDDSDGHVVTRAALDEHFELPEFKEAKIEVVYLNPLS